MGKQEEAIHPIGVAAERAGLSPDVIRAWERRHGVVEPQRDEAGRRVYTAGDIDRLRLLAHATAGGRSIGQVVDLPPAELEELVRQDEAARRAASAPREIPESLADVVDSALQRVMALDAAGLEALLARAASVHGLPLLLRGALAPLFGAIGERWHEGGLSPSQEHLASATVRSLLSRLLGGLSVAADAPGLVVATPPGERHEIGVLMAMAEATVEGWRVTYLGTDLPAADIAGAVRDTRARAVALGAVYAPDPDALRRDVEALRLALPGDVPVLLGGAAAPPFADEAEGVVVLETLDDLAPVLRSLVRR